MKKILIILLIATSCSESDSPEFKIQDPFLQARFDKFVEIATALEVTVPRNNMILRFVPDNNPNVNNSRAYKDGDQLYIDIDQGFRDATFTTEDHTEMVIFQNLANGLLGTSFRDCGIMKKVNTAEDYPLNPDWDYGQYPQLFDEAAPC